MIQERDEIIGSIKILSNKEQVGSKEQMEE